MMSTGTHRPARCMPIPAVVLYLVLCCFVAFPAGAQTQTAGDQNSAEVSSHETPATFKSRVNLVLVPVVVRDGQGRAIGNLTQEDFLIFDKGKPQVITKFSVEKSERHVSREKESPDGNTAGTPPGGNALPVAPERYIAYLFDDIHLVFGDLVQVRDATDRNLASLEPTDRAAIFSTSGQTTLDFTDDRAKLHETLLRLQPRPVSRSAMAQCPDVSYFQADLITNKNDQQAFQAAVADAMNCLRLDATQPGAMQIAQGAARSAATSALSSGDAESRLALNVVRDVVRRISAMPGLRNIILVSPGFFTPYELVQNKTEIMDRAIHANVILSALDARGLYTIIPGGDASQAGTDPVSAPFRARYQTDSALAEADVLAELAAGTGGTFFQNSNDLDAGFKRVATRPEYFYVLGFAPQNLKLDGTFHSLKVTVKMPGKLSLQSRRGYYAPRRLADPAEAAKQEIEDALFSREELHDLPVELHTQFFKASEDSARLSVVVRVDVKRIRFRKADGRNRNDLTIVSGLFDRNGNYVAAVTKVLEMRLKDETLEHKLQSGITLRTSFEVKPGSYLVRLVVRDAEGQVMSTSNGAVEIP
jgi:VWFA-related protein